VAKAKCPCPPDVAEKCHVAFDCETCAGQDECEEQEAPMEKPNFGPSGINPKISVFDRERNCMDFLARLVGDDGGPKLDSLEGWCARVRTRYEGMQDICKRLALLFPAQSMDEMDAADFKDKAGETFELVLEARKVLGVQPIPDYEDPQDE